VALSLREATLDVQLDLFAAGEIDAGFVLHAPGAAPPGFEQLRVIDEALVMALPQHHAAWKSHTAPAAGVMPRLRWRDVQAEPLVIFPRQIAPSLFDALVSAYHAGGQAMRIAQQAIQMQTIVNLVSGGMGVAWVPESLVHLQRAGVRYARVAGRPGPALRCETSLVWRAGAAPVVERFVDHVRRGAGRVSPGR
jgi:DNA-binding transcriptional LysR family regulator